MIYLNNFKLLTDLEEFDILKSKQINMHSTTYPFGIFPKKEMKSIKFDPITIFYGGNGSGKTTLLNIIAERLEASKRNTNNKGDLFSCYFNDTKYELHFSDRLKHIKFITSDDVFDYLLDIRAINSNVHRRKEELANEYYEYNLKSIKSFKECIENYDEFKKTLEAHNNSLQNYIIKNLKNNNIVNQSNGETAISFWEREIEENGLYIIDEPENSLSSENILVLKKFIEDSARFFKCQFIIATHSPFLLALKEAKIYDLDSVPVTVKKWTELNNVKLYYNFFKEHSEEFML